jgi:mannose/cellobiose epimerase-like protein (N-acyl-D-glucosamine 2-epimerase family)
VTVSGGSSEVDNIVNHLRRWAIDKALPLWSSNGFDTRRGGFQERLNPDGSPDVTVPRRLRVQARQIYVYAHAATLGWFPDARRFMLDGVAFMIEHYRAPDGNPGYVSMLAPDNSVANTLRDTYDHMFVILALTWATKVSGDAQVRAELEDALAFIDAHLTASDGSFIEGIPASHPRRQNPHMHAFEAALAMHETINHPQAMARARKLLAMMNEIFFDPKSETLGEYFNDAWMPVSGPDGDCVEPGHQAEWAWLLRKYERLRGLPPEPLAARLLQSALRWSDTKTGLLIDEADRNGPVRRSSRRTWPQTELAKAWIAEAETGAPGAAHKALVALQALADHYLDRPLVGGWTDQFDEHGHALTVHMPASTFYHVFCAIAEADRVLASNTPL